MDWMSIMTVFIFMSALLAAAMYGGSQIAQWEAKRTREQIDDTFRDIRRRLRGNL